MLWIIVQTLRKVLFFFCWGQFPLATLIKIKFKARCRSKLMDLLDLSNILDPCHEALEYHMFLALFLIAYFFTQTVAKCYPILLLFKQSSFWVQCLRSRVHQFLKEPKILSNVLLIQTSHLPPINLLVQTPLSYCDPSSESMHTFIKECV